MRHVLADFAVESEAATAVAMRMARTLGTLPSGLDTAAVVARATPHLP